MAESPSTERALSFGEVAESYDRYRPAPPAAAMEWVLPTPGQTALDIGAGTGALTRRLAERAARVLAVEPDSRMLAVLLARSPAVGGMLAKAEQLPLIDRSVDAVMISSAWHWMDPVVTVAEIERILRPGGVLGVVWNGPDRSVEWVARLLGRRDPSPGDTDGRPDRHRFELPAGSALGALETCLIRWSLPLTRHELVGMAGTYSRVILLPPDRRAQELRAIEGALETSPELAGKDAVELPMSCRCWRAVRS
jgi:SAM-dependent methyltransferase